MSHWQRPHSRLAVLVACLAAGAVFAAAGTSRADAAERGVPRAPASAPSLGTRAAPILSADGIRFRDLDRNGALTPYEDWRLPPDARAADLVSRMTLREKAGTMMHGTLAGIGSPIGASAQGYDLDSVRALVDGASVTSAITRLAVAPADMARHNDAIQEIAERTRLGIPLTVSTDPRHHFQYVLGASVGADGYSKWPEALGFAALRDPAVVRRFAEVARREYRATGIHAALSPQADLYTEPRWSRGLGTFGADPELARRLVRAYVAGFQGGERGLSRDGVFTVVKHWAAYGAAPDGWDGHNYYGRFATVDDASFRAHVRPFEGAFEVGVAGVMPTYSIVRGARVGGREIEAVGAGFNRALLTDLLRGTYRYRGVVVSDWAVTNDCGQDCSDPREPHGVGAIAMPWGVERLTRLERIAKGIDAGIDQFGGVAETDLVVEAVQRGLVTEARVDESARRVLETKFRMGLFENPYVDPEAARGAVNPPDVQREARATQAAAHVVLKNASRVLPLARGTRVFVRGLEARAATAAGLTVVEDPSRAEVVLLRTQTPFEVLHPLHFFGSRQHEGRLDFRAGDPDVDFVRALPADVRVVVSVFMDRPAILGELGTRATAVLANFGASDEALLDVVTGRTRARGRLPFELPSSMAAVEAQHPARPDDSVAPAYPFGAGLVE